MTSEGHAIKVDEALVLLKKNLTESDTIFLLEVLQKFVDFIIKEKTII